MTAPPGTPEVRSGRRRIIIIALVLVAVAVVVALAAVWFFFFGSEAPAAPTILETVRRDYVSHFPQHASRFHAHTCRWSDGAQTQS